MLNKWRFALVRKITERLFSKNEKLINDFKDIETCTKEFYKLNRKIRIRIAILDILQAEENYLLDMRFMKMLKLK